MSFNHQFPEKSNEELRFKSFMHFPLKSPSVKSLVDAGFFYVGKKPEDDLCQCFSCGLKLHQWKPTDVPVKEHEKFKPQCKYLKSLEFSNISNNSSSNTYPQIGDVMHSANINQQNEYLDRIQDQLVLLTESAKTKSDKYSLPTKNPNSQLHHNSLIINESLSVFNNPTSSNLDCPLSNPLTMIGNLEYSSSEGYDPESEISM